jgi:integrase/recombinase XerD
VVARVVEPLSKDAEEFLTYLAIERGRAPASIAAYRRDLRGYETFLRERGVALGDVDTQVIEQYLGLLSASGLAASSRARALVAIRGLHGFARDERGLSNDPSEDVEGPRVPSGVPKALTEAEVLALLDAVVGEDPKALRDRAIVELLYATGLRISELVGLSIGDLDLESRLLRAFGKGSKERILPFGRAADAAVRDWLGPEGRPHLVPVQFARRSDADALFISARGRRMSRQAAWTVVHETAERADLVDKVTPHVLRHSFATHLLDHGADIRVVQELLGHASISTTQIYTKVSQEHLRRAYLEAHPRAAGGRRAAGTMGQT